MTVQTIARLRRKEEAGADIEGERAYVHLGKTNTAILMGRIDLADWDEEELKRGQRRDRNGNFVGRPPEVVPKRIHDELVRRTLSKAQAKLVDNLDEGIDILINLAKGADVDDKVRLQAVKEIMDRVMGKAADRIEVSLKDAPYEEAAQRATVVRRRTPAIDVPSSEAS